MRLLTNLVFEHWPLKLMALILATVLYAGLTFSDSTRTWAGPVPIEVLNAPSGGALLDDPGAVDRIAYRAPDAVADALTNDSFRASIDLSGVSPRAGAEPVEVPVDVFPVDPRVRVVDYSPTGVTLRVDEVVSRMLPVQLDHGPLPEGIELGPVIVEPNQVRVSGASSRLQNVRDLEGRYVVDASGINIDEDVAVQAFDSVGALVPGIDVEPASVRVRADVALQLSYATVPVVPELVGEPAPGKRLGSISVAPSTVTVSGENPSVNRLGSVSTERIDIEGLSSELVTEAGLVLPVEISAPGNETVTVVVTVIDIIGTRAYEVGTAVTGATPGLDYDVREPSVDVVLAGTVARLDEFDPGELVAAVPVDGLDVGDNAVMPVVDIPRGTSLVRVTPQTVTVTVSDPS